MHRIIHKLNCLLSNSFLMYERMSKLHIYPTFNTILTSLLALFGVIFSLKKNIYHGLNFEECYKIIDRRNANCSNALKRLFILLIMLPLLNYIIFEAKPVNDFKIELIIIFMEIVYLYFIIKPIFIVMIGDERIIKDRISKILIDDSNEYSEILKDLAKKVIEYKLFVEHDNLQNVLKYIGSDINSKTYYYIWDVIMKRLRNSDIIDKPLAVEIIKTIIKPQKDNELFAFKNEIRKIANIILNLHNVMDDNYLSECLSQSFLLCKMENYKKTGYKQYISNLIIRVIVYSINQNDIKFLYTVKKAVLKTFNNCYPIELLHIIDGLLFSFTNLDNNVPQNLKNELEKFLNKSDEFISWKQLMEKCKWQILDDYEDYIDAYGIQDYDLNYEPPYNKVISCTYDNIFRFKYYYYKLMNYYYDAGKRISEILNNESFMSNNSWILFELSELIKLFNDKNLDLISAFFKDRLNEELYEHNIGGFNELLSRMNNNVVSKTKGFIDIDRVKKDINDKYERFCFFDNKVRSKSIIKDISQIVYINSETYNEAPNFLQDSIDFTMKNELNDILMSIGDNNKLNKNSFREKYKPTDIAFADEWTIKSIYNDESIYNDLKVKDLKLDVLLYGRYLILSGFAIHIQLNSISISEINENNIDDYITEYRINNNQYYYENKYFIYNDIKDYILNKNKVNMVKYNFIISYSEENKEKVILIDDESEENET